MLYHIYVYDTTYIYIYILNNSIYIYCLSVHIFNIKTSFFRKENYLNCVIHPNDFNLLLYLQTKSGDRTHQYS